MNDNICVRCGQAGHRSHACKKGWLVHLLTKAVS